MTSPIIPTPQTSAQAPPLKALSKKHWLFVEAYAGDVLFAAKVAGFDGADNYLTAKGNALMRDPLIIKAIQNRTKFMTSTTKAIADRQELQELWTAIARNQDPHRKQEVDANNVPIPEGNIPLPTRLKATELIGKSEAMFVERVDMNQNVSLSNIILGSYPDDDKSVEEIEAEYRLMKSSPELPEPDQTDTTPSLQSPLSLDDLI